ncbi:unnamed protein product, partial [marine sediment metagenome]
RAEEVGDSTTDDELGSEETDVSEAAAEVDGFTIELPTLALMVKALLTEGEV